MNVKEDLFFRARAEKDIARFIDSLTRAAWLGPYWFVLNMRMQVILDSSFARPGLAPIRGGKKGEFRDSTRKHQKKVQVHPYAVLQAR